MAEIHVQRKRKNPWWLGLLIVLIVIAVVYYLYTNNYFDQGNVNRIHPPLSGIPALQRS